MTSIEEVEGIGEAYAAKLREAGITSSEVLLNTGCSPAGRKQIEAKTGISHSLILQWVNHVDLFRIKGIGSEYADLLEAAGVDTVAELAQRNPDHLYQAMAAKNEEKHLVRKMPSRDQVANWISEARTLPKIVTY